MLQAIENTNRETIVRFSALKIDTCYPLSGIKGACVLRGEVVDADYGSIEQVQKILMGV